MKKKQQVVIRVFDYAGNFAENKDTARTMRLEHLMPALVEGKEVILDYSGVDTTTQSFTHALTSDAIRVYGGNILERIFFKNCSVSVKKIIKIVVEYMQRNHEPLQRSA